MGVKTEIFCAELNERAEAATGSYSVTGNFLWYIYSVPVTKNPLNIRSRCLVHEFSFTLFFNDINHRHRAVILKKFFMVASIIYIIYGCGYLFLVWKGMQKRAPCLLFIGSFYLMVPSAACEIFSKFLIFFNLFCEPLDEWSNSKIWEIRKIFPILHLTLCNNYCINKCLLKSNVAVVVILTNCIELT